MEMWNDGAYLMHHGIKGQRWGIRRYQNFDGSYTKAGLERYGRSSEKYERKREEYKSIKKDSSKSRYEKQYAKAKMIEAKRQMNKDYKHLALDKKADKGKIRYARGERITTNNNIFHTIAKLSAGVAVGSEYAHRYGMISKRDARYAQYASAGLAIVSEIGGLLAEIPNNQLRAYYSHTSNY